MLNTDRKRIYAIGDIHGCLDELDRVHSEISEDLTRRPHPTPHVVYLGDYTDRGPDSRGVIDRLIQARDRARATTFLFGNHDQRFLAYIDRPNEMSTDKYHWLSGPLGGANTLSSYGVDGGSEDNPESTHDAFVKAVPESHNAFLRNLDLSLRIGSYVFVHAGIRPGVALDAQDTEDLIWIRAPFLNFTGDHGFVVVHGHTPVDKIENHGNRIAVDTGAVFGRRLSCLVLEGDDQAQLLGSYPVPCPPIKAGA